MTSQLYDETAPIVAFGVDATTGEYFGEPITAAALARTIDSKEPNAATILEAVANNVARLGVRPGVDADNLAEAGWGVILPSSASTDLLTPLRPLLALRKEQAGDRYVEFSGCRGYRQNDTPDDFLSRQGAGPGNASRVPYYLLLVGSPEDIPYTFQYGLDVQYAVGRLSFDGVSDYEGYASAVVAAEQAIGTRPRCATFFGPNHDPATRLSAAHLVIPAADYNCSDPRWTCERLIGDSATKHDLLDVLSGGKTRLLFSASHGLVFPPNDPDQRLRQGGILCQDWPGTSRGAVDADWYLSAQDLGGQTVVDGMIALLFGCYTAGTPRFDYFPERSGVRQREIAPRDFVAALPRRLLTHPNGAALAVVGHVERTWSLSFIWPHAGVQSEAFADTIKMLMKGHRLGHALEHFGQRFAELGNRLLEIYDFLRSEPSFTPDPVAFSTLWTARNDARSFMVLGDPAVRLT